MNSIIYQNLDLIKYVPLFFAAAIFVFTAMGWFFGHYRLKKQSGSQVIVRDSLATAIFGLSALVLGFTFSTSANRYSVREDSIRVQAQTLGQVYESLKYLAPSDQLVLKNSLNDLLNLRLTIVKDPKTRLEVDKGADQVLEVTRKIYEQASRAALNAPPETQTFANEILMPQVRNLSTVFFTGIISQKAHPPSLLMRFLFFLLCIGAFLIGYTMAVKNENDWLLAGLYIALIGLSLYVILSLEMPNILMPYEEINRELLLLKEAVSAAP